MLSTINALVTREGRQRVLTREAVLKNSGANL